MSVIKICFILSVLLFPLTVKAQSAGDYSEFSRLVASYKLPEDLKFNCEWMYATVKVEINQQSKITKYKVVSSLPDTMKYNFNFLIGYKFPEKMKLKGHSLLFHFSIDNSAICIPKPGQKIFYGPNQVVGLMFDVFQKVKLEDPATIIVPYLIIRSYPAPQE